MGNGDGAGLLRNSDLESPRLTTRERDLFMALKQQNRLNYLQCLMVKGVAGRFGKPVFGNAIGSSSQFIQVIRNGQANPISVTIAAQFAGGPGKQVKLSFSGSQAASEVVDYLGNTAAAPSFGKVISDPILLVPGQELFVACADPVFPLDAGDLLTVRVFDVAKFLTDGVWESTPQ